MDDLHRNIKRCTYCTDDLSRRKAVVRGPKKNGMDGGQRYIPFFFKVHKIIIVFTGVGMIMMMIMAKMVIYRPLMLLPFVAFLVFLMTQGLLLSSS